MRLGVGAILYTWIFFGVLYFLPHAQAQVDLPFDPSLFSEISELVVGDAPEVIIRSVGLATDHRPYEPATPLGTSIGLDLGIEATLVKLPDEFSTALQNAGLTSTTAPPSIPLPRILIHKGIGNRVDIGLSWIGYRDYKIYGGDFKVVLSKPDEGLTWALRLNYARSKISFVKTQTFTPQLLVSRKLAFADPYMGIGYQWSKGSITVPIPLPAPFDSLTQDVTAEATGKSFMSFLGVLFVLGPTGIRIGLEGSYNASGHHTLGTKVGLRL